jgi:hypothetical protein
MQYHKLFSGLVLCLGVLLLLTSPALANSNTDASFVLNTPNSQLASSPAPYGTVALHLNNNGTITITVTMASNFGIGGTYGIAGGGPAFGLNGPSGLTITSQTSGFFCCGPSGSGYGNFQYVVNGPPPGGNPPTSLVLVVSINGGFTSVGQLGTLFMAHVIPPNGSPTGFATTGTTSMVDGDPSAFALLTLALSGCALATFLRSRSNRT